MRGINSPTSATIIALIIIGLFLFFISFSVAHRIKANGSSGIYFQPGCQYYSATVIGNHPDDQWFLTQGGAIESGFRSAKYCND